MLYTENLEHIIFHRHEIFEADELMILSGYVGPKPVENLIRLPFPTKVIYGMYGTEGIRRPLHDALVAIQSESPKINIYYSQLPVHSKCYVWKRASKIVHALIGSANFSKSGLNTPYREILAETTFDTFDPLNSYLFKILTNSISCLEAGLDLIEGRVPLDNEICLLSLLGRDGEVQNAAGLNWGQNPKNHTTINDSYIKITTTNIREFPEIFPEKQTNPLKLDGRGKVHRHNDSIEIIWDDGTSMDGLLFGNQVIDGKLYPKQVSSFPHASEMGLYLRRRLRVPPGQPVRRLHLERYGRFDIAVTLLKEGIYRFDFSV